MELDKIQLDALYAKAEAGFIECAANQADEIVAETGVPFDSIVAVWESVRITISGVNKDSYTVETKLTLRSDIGQVLGWYCLHEDENENFIDDFLVFE